MRFLDQKPRGPGEILDDAVGLYRRNAWPLMAAGGVLLFPAGVVLGFASMAFQIATAGATASASGFEGAASTLVASSFLFALLGLYSLVALFARGVLILGAARIYGGEPVEPRALIAAAWSKALPYLITEFLVSLAVGFGALFFLVPGAIFAVFFGLSGVVVMVEDKSLFDAMRRSFELVTSHWWRVAGLLLGISLLSTVLQSIVTVPGQLVGLVQFAQSPESLFATGSRAVSAGVQSLLAALAVVLVAPLAALAQTGLFIDLRVRREGEDLEAAVEALA
jgi:hypothetical protein